MSISLNKKQQLGLKLSKEWFFGTEVSTKDPNRIFIIAGLAGTGKTTLLKYLIENLDLEDSNVRSVAFTGMATSNLLKKGNRYSSTFHSFIYDCHKDESGNIITTLKDPKEFPVGVDLVIIEEYSMANTKIVKDLITFVGNKAKILAIGDMLQLPPIEGTSYLMEQEPDVFLDEIMRQALDNPIIWLSNEVRLKNRIYPGVYGDNVLITNKDDISLEMMANADQIIAGRNNTVNTLNQFYRKNILGIDNINPQIGERIMCLRNSWMNEVAIHKFKDGNNILLPLVNGLICTLEEKEAFNKTLLYKTKIKPYIENIEEDAIFKNIFINAIPFIGEERVPNMKRINLLRRGIEETYGVIDFKFAYVTTVHKVQGSEFDNVLLLNEVLNSSMHSRWLYTGITRAKNQLILGL